MTTVEAQPSPWEITQAVDTLRAAGCVFRLPLAIRFYTVAEAASALRVNPKWVKEHLEEFPDTLRLPGGHLRISFAAIQSFATRHRAK